jgi:hypothetical protein
LLVPSDPVSRLPSGVYTIPEIATVGLDEHGARRHFGGASSGARDSRKSRAARSTAASVAAEAHRRSRRPARGGRADRRRRRHRARAHRQLGLAAELDVDAYVDNVFNFPDDGRGVSHRRVRHRQATRPVSSSEVVADVLSAIL